MPNTGTRIGPYEVVNSLGAGGMGDVYRARDTRLGRDVALKMLPASFSVDPERLLRFEHEARAAAALNHPNILILHDIGTSDEGPFLVTELLDGETLRELVTRGPLPVRKATEYAVQIARGLAAAHERGIVHRDLKPENVFVTRDGVVKILDFGLAKLQAAGARGAAGDGETMTTPGTQAGTILGTVGYMSPEQVRGEPADERSDLFSLGAVIYEMLSGQRAFRADTAAETMTAILKTNPPELSAATVAIPPALERIVSRCLEKNPSARFKSADDLAFALETLSSPSSSRVESVPAPQRVQLRRRLLSWVPLVLGVALTAAAGWIYASRPGSERPLIRFAIVAPEGWGHDVPFRESGGLPLAASPDGRFVAGRAANSAGQFSLWLRAMDAVDSRIIEGTAGASVFFWSPDSRSIAFVANGRLQKVDVDGDSPTTVAPVEFALGGAWGPNGVILLGSRTGVQRLSSDGGMPALELALAPDEAFHSIIGFLPDGEHYFFVAGLGEEVRGGARRRAYVGSLGSPERVLLFDSNQFAMPIVVSSGHLLFLRGNVLMAQPFDSRYTLTGEPVRIVDGVQLIPARPYGMVTASGNGVLAYVPEREAAIHQIAWVDRTGRVIAEVGERGNYSNVELSPDGSRAIIATLDIARRTRDIWLFDLARALRTRFTFDPGEERTAVWSPDGATIVFNAQRKGTERDLFARAANGSGSESTVLADGLSKDAMSWSPDGRFLLYRVISTLRNDIWVQPMTGDRKPYAFVATPFDENYGRFSPDGRWVAYSSDESGEYQVFVVPFPGPGGKWQVSTTGGAYPRWRGDGRELFYLAPDNSMMSVPVEPATTAFQVGAAERLFVAPVAAQAGYQYAVAADGSRFLVNIAATRALPVTVVVEWTGLLKQ